MNALIIFIKNPELGKVKTRLARTVGDAQALEIYTELLKITRENVQKLAATELVSTNREGVQLYLFYSNFIDINDAWSNTRFIKKVQKGDDLGARMYNAFEDVFKNHSKVCIIGSDCPTLSPDILKKAFENLKHNEFVIGPSTDGGYYLLGINNENREPFKYIFEKIKWSTEHVLPETIKKIDKKYKTYFLLPTLTDIDEETDWLNYLSILKN